MSEKDKSLADARQKLQKAIDQDGPYTHNLLSIILRQVADKHGYDEANNLVEEFDLETLFGIPTVHK